MFGGDVFFFGVTFATFAGFVTFAAALLCAFLLA